MSCSKTFWIAEFWLNTSVQALTFDSGAYIDDGVLGRSVGSLHFPLHLDLLAWFPLVSHHQLPDSSTHTHTVVKKPCASVCVCVCQCTDQLTPKPTCDSSTATCTRQTPGRPCPRPPRWPGRTPAPSTWSGSGRCFSCPHWNTKNTARDVSDWRGALIQALDGGGNVAKYCSGTAVMYEWTVTHDWRLWHFIQMGKIKCKRHEIYTVKYEFMNHLRH